MLATRNLEKPEDDPERRAMKIDTTQTDIKSVRRYATVNSS